MEVIDWGQYFGANIDRRTNVEQRLNQIATGKKHYNAYVPSNIKWGDDMSMHFRMVVKLETDIKLNLITDEG